MKKDLVVKGSQGLGTAVGTSIGAGVDAATGFTDEGLFTWFKHSWWKNR